MADHRFIGRYRNLLGPFTEHGGDAQIFHFVVFRRRGAVRVDVVDLFRRHAGIRQCLAHTADDRFAVGAGAGAVERVGQFTTAGNDPENRGAARDGGFVAFKHQCACAFRHHKAVAILRERFGRSLGRLVLGRQRRQQGKPDNAFRIDRPFGCDAQGGVRLAATNGFNAELDRRGAGCAGRRK